LESPKDFAENTDPTSGDSIFLSSVKTRLFLPIFFFSVRKSNQLCGSLEKQKLGQERKTQGVLLQGSAVTGSSIIIKI
jgi:hypothetical protein